MTQQRAALFRSRNPLPREDMDEQKPVKIQITGTSHGRAAGGDKAPQNPAKEQSNGQEHDAR